MHCYSREDSGALLITERIQVTIERVFVGWRGTNNGESG
jgi:hypothetical protein